MLKIAVVLEPCEEGGFSAHVPTVPGCFGEGETASEAVENVRRAIELHLQSVEDDFAADSKVVQLVWERGRTAPAETPGGKNATRPLEPL